MEYRIIDKMGKVKEDQWYLAAITEDADRVDMTTYWMQASHIFSWLIPMQYVNYEGRNAFYYDMEGQEHVDLSKAASTKEGVLNVLIGICDAVTEAERHLICPNQLVWDWNYIFRAESGLRFIAVPIQVDKNSDSQVAAILCGALSAIPGHLQEQSWYQRLTEYITSAGRINYRSLRAFLYQLRVERQVESAHPGQTTLLTADLDPARQLRPVGAGTGNGDGWRNATQQRKQLTTERQPRRFFNRRGEKAAKASTVQDEIVPWQAGRRDLDDDFGGTIIVRAV